MSYSLNFIEILKALIIPFNFYFWFLVIILPLIFIIPYIYQRRKMFRFQDYIWYILPLLIIPVIAILLISKQYVGAGWVLLDNKLKLNTPPVSAEIDLNSAVISFVNSSGPWQPRIKLNGYGTPGVSIGLFKLQNGKKAIVFRHLYSENMLILKLPDKYYVIEHPNVEILFYELVKRGAKQISPNKL